MSNDELLKQYETFGKLLNKAFQHNARMNGLHAMQYELTDGQENMELEYQKVLGASLEAVYAMKNGLASRNFKA